MLQSTNVPSGAIPLQIDPPEADQAADEAADEAEASMRMMDGVRAVREKHEAAMMAYCEAYYEAKGEREPTRQALIPLTFEAHREKLEASLSTLIARSVRHIREAMPY